MSRTHRLGPLGALLTWGLFGLAPAFAADLPLVAPAPWVVDRPFNPEGLAAPSSGGTESLWYDHQTNTVTGDDYYHIAYRIANSGGVDDGSRLTVNVDPVYETLRVHRLVVWRQGRPRDLPPRFEALRREQRLEEQVYDGVEVWTAILADIRVGDIVEVALTVTGNNPVFAGRFAAEEDWWSSRATARWYRSLWSETPVEVRTWGEVPTATTEPRASGLTTTWAWSPRPAQPFDVPQVPGDQVVGPRWIASSWPTWASVATWAVDLFAAGPEAEVTAAAAALAPAGADDEARARALLTWVQDEVRYFGVEGGLGSHRPRTPAEVLATRFGDCKDKTALFCALARASGLEAWPVLVHSSRGPGVLREGPTPLAFDHVIAAVRLGPSVAYVDPTAASQGGRLLERSRRDFVWGLEVRSGIRDLTFLMKPLAGRLRIERDIVSASWQADLEVREVILAVGEVANEYRHWHRTASMDEWKKGLTEGLGEGTVIVQDPVWTDDREKNEVTLTYSYRRPSPWKGEGRVWKAEFSPKSLQGLLWPEDEAKTRVWPAALGRPRSWKLIERYQLPIVWRVTPSHSAEKGRAYRLDFDLRQVDERTVVFETSVFHDADRIAPEDWPKYIENLASFRNATTWTFTHTEGPSEANLWGRRVGAGLVAVVLGAVAAWAQSWVF